MKLRYLASTLALALTTVAAQAQIGLYLNPIFTHVTNSVPDQGTFAFLGQNGTSQMFGGVSMGGYYTFADAQHFDLSADVRYEVEHGNNALLNTFLVAPRIQLHPTVWNVRPYAQLGIGAGTTHSPINQALTTRLAYSVYAGADKALAKHIDWRIIEIGYGSVTTTSSNIYGGGVNQIPSSKTLSISGGLVFRIK